MARGIAGQGAFNVKETDPPRTPSNRHTSTLFDAIPSGAGLFVGAPLMGTKMPFMKFYPGDWIKDTRGLTPLAKGGWIDLLCFMWEADERGKITRPKPILARLLGMSDAELDDFMGQLQNQSVCECVTECNGDVTLISRRMTREEVVRKQTLRRVKRFRNGDVTQKNGNVTPKKSEARSQKSDKNNVSIPPDLSHLADTIHLWLQHKRERGQTYKKTGIIQLWRKLRSLGDQAKEAIHHSIANNYSGVFPPGKAGDRQNDNPARIPTPPGKYARFEGHGPGS